MTLSSRPWRLVWWAALALLTAGAAAAQDAAPAPASLPAIAKYRGLLVRAIEFRGMNADEHVMSGLRQRVAQPLNQPLEPRNVSRSLKALFETGRFADLEAEVQQTSPTEATLVFAAKPNYFVRSLNASGAPRRPSNAQLLDMSKVQLGQVFTTEKIRDSIAAMKQALVDNGWYQASVSDAEEFHDATQTVDVVFNVQRGEPATIGQVIVQGTPGYSTAAIRAIAHLHPGDTVSAERLSSAMDRLRKEYSSQERLEAQISIAKRVYHSENNTLDYVLHIDRGPLVEVRERGGGLSRAQLRRMVPIYEEHAADEDLLNEGRLNIRDYLQTQGYFDAEVNYVTHTDPGGENVRIVYEIEKGEKHNLTDVVFDGNKYFGTDMLRERIEIQPASWPLLPHGHYSQEMLGRDADAITALYSSNGFEEVKVTPEVKDNYQGVTGRMAVFFHIDEGPQVLVRNLEVIGNTTYPGEQLTTALAANATELYNISGQPFSQDNIAKDRDSILNFYFNQGFPDVSFEAKATPVSGDPSHEDVTYTIHEGQREYVDRIVTTGLKYTKPFVAGRQFDIHEGQPLSQVKMLDTQRHLYDLGVFNEVRMAVQNPEGDAQYKNLMVQFQEARRWTLTYGLGVEIQSGFLGARTNPQGEAGASPRVSLDVNRINFGGRAHTLSFQSHVGRLEQRGLISYDAPRWYGHPNLRLTLTSFYDNSLDVRTFTSKRLEGSIQLEQVVNRASTLLYRFTYRRVSATNLVVDPSLIPLYSRPVRVGMPSLTYIRDKRDDPIDSHNGNYTTFDAGVASGVFGSETAFGRALAQNVTYTSFRSNAPSRRFVFARSLRVGVAEPFGNTTSIPLPERFFAGGGNTLRGFAINQAGPRDLTSGLPLGGNALLVNNFELRLPTANLPWVGDNLGLVLFEDAGNIFDTTSTMGHSLFRWHQPHPDECKAVAAAQTGGMPDSAALASACRFDYISHSVGGGIRYRTPIGPVRFDLGYNLNPPVFPVLTIDSLTGRVTTSRYDQLGHFNFFFSIGQTF